mmetsp:Transcript_13666/g.32144  ORF Transcript_13666/g.32144 Transcript_13666/m.32144 type:complete len:102 (-) Transcript_13666:1231-1536(-)
MKTPPCGQQHWTPSCPVNPAENWQLLPRTPGQAPLVPGDISQLEAAVPLTWCPLWQHSRATPVTLLTGQQFPLYCSQPGLSLHDLADALAIRNPKLGSTSP